MIIRVIRVIRGSIFLRALGALCGEHSFLTAENAETAERSSLQQSYLSRYPPPPYANRALAAGSERIARTGFLTAAGYSIIWFGMVVSLGVMGRVIAPSVAPDDIFMDLATRFSPPGMVGLVIVAVAAIIMSSQESVLNAGAVSFTRDIVDTIRPGVSSDSTKMVITRVVTLLVGTLAIIAAIHAPSIIDGLLIIYSLWAPSVLPVFVLGILLPKPCRQAGLPAMLTGAAVSLIWQFGLNSAFGIPAILVGLAGNLIVYGMVAMILHRRGVSVPTVR